MKREHGSLSLVAMLFAGLMALANCVGTNVVGDRDGDTPDASANDRPTTPSGDRPTTSSDASDDVADVNSNPDSGPEAAVDASQHEDAAPDNATPPPDAGPTMCLEGVAPPRSGACAPRLDPAMTREPFACTRTCEPTSVNVYVGTSRVSTTITCAEDEVYGVTYATLTGIMSGTYPCIGHSCVRYSGATEPSLVLLWDDTCSNAAIYRCAAGTTPSRTSCTIMSDMPQVTVDTM